MKDASLVSQEASLVMVLQPQNLQSISECCFDVKLGTILKLETVELMISSDLLEVLVL